MKNEIYKLIRKLKRLHLIFRPQKTLAILTRFLISRLISPILPILTFNLASYPFPSSSPTFLDFESPFFRFPPPSFHPPYHPTHISPRF